MAELLIAGDSISVSMSDGLQRHVSDLIDRAAPETVAALRKHARLHYEQTYRDWPVGRDRPDREHSRDLLTHGVKVRGLDSLTGFVASQAPYTRYIKGKKQGGKSTYRETLIKPGLARARPLAREIAGELLRGK